MVQVPCVKESCMETDPVNNICLQLAPRHVTPSYSTPPFIHPSIHSFPHYAASNSDIHPRSGPPSSFNTDRGHRSLGFMLTRRHGNWQTEPLGVGAYCYLPQRSMPRGVAYSQPGGKGVFAARFVIQPICSTCGLTDIVVV